VRESVSPDERSICDALLSPAPGALTFPINRAYLSDGLVVSDDQVRDAMRFAFSVLKLVVSRAGPHHWRPCWPGWRRMPKEQASW